MPHPRHWLEWEELVISTTQRDLDRERSYARARMRAKRQNPEFVRREKAADRARRRLAREHFTRFRELMEEELAE